MITHRFDQKGAVFVLVGTAIPRTFKMLREAQEYVRDFEG